MEGKGLRISSGAVTVKLIPGSSLYNYCVSLSDPTQAQEYSGCNFEVYVQKNIFGEQSYRLEERLISEKCIHSELTCLVH